MRVKRAFDHKISRQKIPLRNFAMPQMTLRGLEQLGLSWPPRRAAVLRQRAIKGGWRWKVEGWGEVLVLRESRGLWPWVVSSFFVYPCPLKDILTKFIFWARDSELLMNQKIPDF